jgi:hypothetical protein
MNRIRQAWEILRGRADIDQLNRVIGRLHNESGAYQQRIFDLERDSQMARVGVRDLQAKFEQLGGEAKIKAGSDAVGISIIDDMKANPSKYVPKAPDGH